MPELSVQLYSVREAMAADRPGTLRALADIGLRQVEAFGVGTDLGDGLAEDLAAAGLRATSAHARLVADPDGVDAALRSAQALGVTTLIDPHIPEDRWTEREAIEASARALTEIAARAAGEHGLRVGYHNHWWELGLVEGATALEVLADALGDDVVLEVDTYWVQVGGTDPAALLGRLGERVTHLHIKDGDASRDTLAQLPAGQGVLDVPGILAAAPHAVPVLEFDAYAGDMLTGIAASYAYVRELV